MLRTDIDIPVARSPSVDAHRIRLKVSRASSSVIRMMRLRLSVRAAALSKKCCDLGPNPLLGSPLAVAVEIELQLNYIPGNDHDDGAQSRCCGLGAGISLQR